MQWRSSVARARRERERERERERVRERERESTNEREREREHTALLARLGPYNLTTWLVLALASDSMFIGSRTTPHLYSTSPTKQLLQTKNDVHTGRCLCAETLGTRQLQQQQKVRSTSVNITPTNTPQQTRFASFSNDNLAITPHPQQTSFACSANDKLATARVCMCATW